VAKATTLGTLIATVVYILSTVSIMGMIPAAQLKTSVTPFADAAVLIWGHGAAYWVSAGVAIAAFGALNGYILIQGQLPFAIAKDKLFPTVFMQVNSKGIPVLGVVISSVFVSVFMCMNYTKGLVDQFKFLMLMTTSTILIPYIFCTASYLILRFKLPFQSSKYLALAILLATLTFIFCLWLMIGLGQESVFWGFFLTMSSVPIYVFAVWKREKSENNSTFPKS
jgi:APA family basic amino acid/polyamine antiporter